MKGMCVDIFTTASYKRTSGSWGGHAFGHVQRLTIVATCKRSGDGFGEEVPVPRDCQVFDPTPDAPAAVLVERTMGTERVLHVEPLALNRRGRHFMAGGAYAATSDGRWGGIVGFYGAVNIHDRYENVENQLGA